MKNIPPNLYPKVLDLINETYVDKMDSIESAQVDESGIIEAIAIDEGDKFVCRYADKGIEIQLLSSAPESSVAGFASSKPRNCKTGFSCGNSCVSRTRNKFCSKNGTEKQEITAKEIAAEVNPKFVDAAKKAKNTPSDKKGSVSDIGKKREAKEVAKKVSHISKGKLIQGDDLGAAKSMLNEAKRLIKEARIKYGDGASVTSLADRRKKK